MVCRGRVSIDLSTAHGFGDVIRQQAVDAPSRTFLVFDDTTFTFAETYREASRYANLFLAQRDPARPFHVGVLMDNLPAFVFAELGCALAGAALVGLNPTRTGARWRATSSTADCQLVLVEGATRRLREAGRRAILVASPLDGSNRRRSRRAWPVSKAALAGVDRHDPQLAGRPDASADDRLHLRARPAPKGVLNSQGRLAMLGWGASQFMCQLHPADDVVYCAMPLYPRQRADPRPRAAAARRRAPLALARRFSKSAFSPTSAATAPRCSTTSATRSPTSWTRRSARTTPTTRCDSRTATRRRGSTSPPSRGASVARDRRLRRERGRRRVLAHRTAIRPRSLGRATPA